MTNKPDFDIVILGSGLGSLLSANILCKEAYKVAVFEKHHQIGGNLQDFKRRDCQFETGMHYIGSLDKDQILHKYFTYLDILDKIELEELDPKAFDRVHIKDKEYNFAKSYEGFANSLKTYFPTEVEAIDTYVAKLKEIWESTALLNLKEVDFTDLLYGNPEYQVNAFKYIEGLTQNEELRAVLAGNNGLFAGNASKTPLYVLANINSFYINSAWRIVSGGSSLANALADNIKAMGGVVETKAEITKFEFEGNKISSVIINGERRVTAEQFISGAHPNVNFKLMDSGKFRRAYVERIKSLENSPGAFTLYVELKKQSFPHFNSNIYYSEDTQVWNMGSESLNEWPRGFMLYTTRDGNTEFAKSLTIISLMDFKHVQEWEDSVLGKRPESYKEFKKLCTNKLLAVVAKKFPEINESLSKIHSSTPLTYRDYTGTEKGSMYGIVKDCEDSLGTYLSAKTKIPNFYLTGQNINLHGMLGVAMGSLITVANLVDLNSVIKKIRETK